MQCCRVDVKAEGMFISTESLACLMDCADAMTNLRILDVSIKPEGGDVVYKDFAAQRICGARYFDLTLARDFSKPYPFMMPE